jgi:hypothetical protein
VVQKNSDPMLGDTEFRSKFSPLWIFWWSMTEDPWVATRCDGVSWNDGETPVVKGERHSALPLLVPFICWSTCMTYIGEDSERQCAFCAQS